jgi:hypothetical protein
MARAAPSTAPRALDIVGAMHERELEEVARRLRHLTRRVRDAAALAALAAAAAVALAAVATALAASLGLAALVGGGMAGASALRRRGMLEALALVRGAYVIPEVEAFARKVAGARERRRTARALRRMIGDAGDYPALWLPERVSAVEPELRELADALSADHPRLAPIGAVACRQLVTNPVRSPLYNPELPVEELEARLHTIRQTLHD